MATVFVTGGNGFVGSHLIETLARDGHTIRAFARDPDRLRWLPRECVEIVPGDLDDRAALERGARGTDAVFHLAALLRARSEEEMFGVNVEGTRNVLDACLAAETPPALVFLSSQAAGGPSTNDAPVTEETTPRPLSSYGRSKLAAERLLQMHEEKLPIKIVRSPSVYGPRDRAFLSLFRYAARGWLPHPGRPGRVSIVQVGDLAEGLQLVGFKGSGTYYVTDGALNDLATILRAIAAAVGRQARVVTIPPAIFVGAMWLWERVARFGGRTPPISAERAREAVAREWICSDERARREVGFRARRTLEIGMKETAEWYRSEGWL